jgi:RNA polymerase sigma factor for flagellar operon FliA
MSVATELWTQFAAGNDAARNQLLTDHLGLVHHVARQLSRTLSVKADLDEMVSAGTTGLMHALQGFDPSRGLTFSTFAAPRIRGAILDELRRQDHVPRSVRRKARDLTQAHETLQRIFGRPAEDAEIAEHLGITIDVLWRWEADIEASKMISLDQTPQDDESPVTYTANVIADDRFEDVEKRINNEQEVTLLRDAILQLKDQERVVLSLYYFEELKLHEIAEVLGVTESRASQIRSRAIGKLREKLRPLRTFVG